MVRVIDQRKITLSDSVSAPCFSLCIGKFIIAKATIYVNRKHIYDLMIQLMAGGGVVLIGITLVPLLSGLFG